jgi:hypothetical protein
MGLYDFHTVFVSRGDITSMTYRSLILLIIIVLVINNVSNPIKLLNADGYFQLRIVNFLNIPRRFEHSVENRR